MRNKRAILKIGNSVSDVRRGPIRSGQEATKQANSDLKKLEKHYSGHTGAVISENEPLFNGMVDSIFYSDE